MAGPVEDVSKILESNEFSSVPEEAKFKIVNYILRKQKEDEDVRADLTKLRVTSGKTNYLQLAGIFYFCFV